jgi:2,2-dialkylglycine decarboxylase (pyruvate)
MTCKNQKNLEIWNKYGDNVLMVMPFEDNIIVKAKDCIIEDADGNQFLDLASGQLCAVLGHNHPKLVERIVNQAREIIHSGTNFLSLPVMEAASKLAEVATGDLKKSIFLSTGSEANECALRLAKIHTQRTGVVGFTLGYSGMTLAMRSISSSFGVPIASRPAVPNSHSILTPYCRKCPVDAEYPQCDFLCLQVSENELGRDKDQIAAFIIEPIISAGGMIVPPDGYFKRLKEFANGCGALLIADEAQTGFGRTGKWFGMELFDVTPDILVVSKSAGGGFPASAVITTDEIADDLMTKKATHMSSHQSDPLPAAAVSAVIDTVREEGLVEKAKTNGQYFKERLQGLMGKWPIVADVRGEGLMLGFELDEDNERGKSKDVLAFMLEKYCKQRGVWLSYGSWGGVFRLLPPLTITRKQIDQAISELDKSFEDLASEKEMASIGTQNPYTKGFISRYLASP